MKRLGVFLFLVLTPIAWGQSVELPPTVQAEPGTFAIIPAKTDCGNLQWVVIDPGLSMIPPALLKDSKTAVVMSGKAGQYRLLAYGAKADVASPPAICTVIIGTAPPGPGPGPGPGPTPTVTNLWVVVVEQASERTPEQARVLEDLGFWQGLSKAGHKWRIADVDDPETKAAGYLAAMEKAKVVPPALILTDLKGKALSITPLPPSTAAIQAEMKKYLGKGVKK